MKCPVSPPHWLVGIALVFPSHRPLHYQQIPLRLTSPRVYSARIVLRVLVRLCGSAGASSACNRRAGAAVLQMLDSAALSRGAASHIQLPPGPGAWFSFAFGDLHWLLFHPCLPAFRGLVLIGRDLWWILCLISLHHCSALWICVCVFEHTHTFALLAVWGHCDGDTVYGSLSQIKRITVEASERWPWRLTGSVHRRRNMRIKQVELWNGVKSAHMAESVIPNLVDDRNLFGSCRRLQSSSWSVRSDFLFIRRSPHTHTSHGAKGNVRPFSPQWEVCKTNRIAAKSAPARKHFEEHQNEVSETRHIWLMSGTSLMTSSTPHPPRKLIALIKRRANPKTLRRDVRN